MGFLLASIVGKMGVGSLFVCAWGYVKPHLEAWAKQDDEYDWDDKAVEILDTMVKGIGSKIDGK